MGVGIINSDVGIERDAAWKMPFKQVPLQRGAAGFDGSIIYILHAYIQGRGCIQIYTHIYTPQIPFFAPVALFLLLPLRPLREPFDLSASSGFASQPRIQANPYYKWAVPDISECGDQKHAEVHETPSASLPLPRKDALWTLDTAQ